MAEEKTLAERERENKIVKSLAEELKCKGNDALKDGDEDKAILYYTKAIGLVPDSAIYHANRSAAYYQKGYY